MFWGLAKSKKAANDLGELTSLLSNGLMRVALNPDINYYQPHEKQVIFHKSLAKQKLYIGGNRSGKTVGGIVEDIWWLTGKHPFRETPRPPVRGRLICVDFPNGFEKIAKPVLQQWLPPSELIDGSWSNSFNHRTRTLTLANGSFLEIMSYDQELDAFAGASRHFFHCDEEPPSAIYTECRARLVDTAGSAWITMTPVEGMTWVYDKLYEPVVKTKTISRERIEVIEVDMTDNPHVGQNEIDDFLDGMDETEKKARKSGKFVQMGGLIFKDFDPDKHVIDSIKGKQFPRDWRIIASLDHGFNNPTAWLLHAVSPKDTVVTFAEIYRSEWTVKQHVNALKTLEKIYGVHPELYIGDPAIKQRSAINGNSIQLEYSMAGVPIKPSNNDPKVGIARMVEYQRAGKWFITKDCAKLLWEMRRYKWKTRESRKLQEKHGAYDEPHKKDDHACDSARYFFVSLPKLAPESMQANFAPIRRQLESMLNAKSGFNIFSPAVAEPNHGYGSRNREEFSNTDEHLGGMW